MEDSSDNRLREARATFNMDGAYSSASPLRAPTAKVYRAKVFKSGNSLALRLPAALGLEAGMEMELAVQGDAAYALKRIEPPKRGIDISGFAGKCPWLKPIPRELKEFEERPSTIARRLAMGLD